MNEQELELWRMRKEMWEYHDIYREKINDLIKFCMQLQWFQGEIIKLMEKNEEYLPQQIAHLHKVLSEQIDQALLEKPKTKVREDDI